MTYTIKLDMQQHLFSVLYMDNTIRIGKNCFNKRIALNYYAMWLEFKLQYKINFFCQLRLILCKV